MKQKKVDKKLASCVGGPLDGYPFYRDNLPEGTIYDLTHAEMPSGTRSFRYQLLRARVGGKWCFWFVGYG